MAISKTELAALDLLIALKEAGDDDLLAPSSLEARFTPAAFKVVKVATRYTPAVVNVATNFIGLRARGEGLAEMPDVDSLSLEDLIEAREKAMKE